MHIKSLSIICVMTAFVCRSPAAAQPPQAIPPPAPPNTDAAARGGRRVEVDEISSGALNIDRWAVIVGISKYQHKDWDLKYADRDADELEKLLQKGAGGGFAKDHILKLTNEKATTGGITKALRSFLKKPGKDDVVLLYFSCHGTPDPDRPNLVYLLTHDTDPDDISGTALPMREINACIQEYLRARRVVILADTCHSAAIGTPGSRAAGPRAAPTPVQSTPS